MPDRSTEVNCEESGAGVSNPTQTQLVLSLPPGQLGEFFLIFQQGFTIFARVGSSLKSLLCDELGLSQEYVTERITTIFLSGKPIDNLDSAIVQDGATVALSAAMPGLVGATMRRGGYYAAMRGAITYRADEGDAEGGFGAVRIKLFNLLLNELGPGFLQRGIFLPETVLQTFLTSRGEAFWESCSEMRLNGSPASREQLLRGDGFGGGGMASLSVHFKE